METFNIENLIKQRFEVPVHSKKIEYEYQALGLEMQEFFPIKDRPRLWMTFFTANFTERLIRDAFKECQIRNIKNINYLITIINNQLYPEKRKVKFIRR